MTDLTVKGNMRYVIEQDAEPRASLSEAHFTKLACVSLNELPAGSDLEIHGDLYIHPHSHLLYEGWASYLTVDIVAVPSEILTSKR